MSVWNYDLSAAPRGGYVEDTLPGRGGSTRKIKRWIAPRVIMATKCGKVVTTRWLPPDDADKRPVGRWEFFNVDEHPLAWLPYPKHPMENGNGT